MPVVGVEGGRLDLDQDLIVLGDGPLRVPILQDVRQTVFAIDDGFHADPL